MRNPGKINSVTNLATKNKAGLNTKQTIHKAGQTTEEALPYFSSFASVTGDTPNAGDTSNPSGATLSSIVTSVTSILDLGLPDWEEIALLDALQSRSGISKTSFAHLVASRRCFSDEVMPSDQQQLDQLIDWKNVTLDFNQVIPHMASDLLHDGRILNIDPIMLWQYLFPATLSMLGSKANLIVGSHATPAISWTCIVGESGIGKSRAENVILAPLKAWQKAEYDRFKTEWAEYKKTQNKKSDDHSSFQEPPDPERKFLFVIATIQAVMRRLSEQGQNGSLWARDEIAGLFKSLGQFTAKGEGEGLECLLPMWDGAPAPVDRVLHDDSYHVKPSRLSMAGGIQPGVFRKIFSDPDDAQGIQARFLFALPKIQPAKRVKGYCHLSDLLPAFYSWVDTQFPAGNIKLSRAADARYDVVYESIGQQAEVASTPAVRAWMRKLPGQMLRIALALHVIECYHEPLRPRHELQVDTLNRAVDMCRYYARAFEVVQESISDSSKVSSILLKIWDLAATSPQGLAVRDAYRHIKALSRRAKEQGRNVAAYTTDLYYQLEAMGRGSVQKAGRLVRFVAGGTNLPESQSPSHDPKNPPDSPNDTNRVTVVTVDEPVDIQKLEVSPSGLVSPVTLENLSQMDIHGSEIDVLSFPVGLDTNPRMENIIHRFDPSLEYGDKKIGQASYPDPDTQIEKTQNKPAQFFQALPPDEPSDAPGGEILIEVEPVSCSRIIHTVAATTQPFGDDKTQLLNQTELQLWLDSIASVQSADECMDCMDALHILPPAVIEQIWKSAEPLLPRFWSVAEIEQANGELQQTAGIGFSTKASPQQQVDYVRGDAKAKGAGAEKPTHQANAKVKDLITGLWVRTRDNFYGHLGAMTHDGRWWVLSPKTRNDDAQSRLYAAANIIPMPI